MPSNQFHRVEKLVGENDAWQDVTLQNSWANAGGGFSNAQYYKDKFNIVHLRGAIDTGTSGTTAFTLPSGYRPSSTTPILVLGTSGAAGNYISVNTNGQVAVTRSGATIHLNNVSFRV